ncbi:MAG: SAM-dependent methyltransferase [Clostridia bacterium]|nr:SAM-dependent methyltransferase [Clostridia bacterium]
MKNIIENALSRKILKRIVFSKPRNTDIKKISASVFSSKDREYVQFESFTADNKAMHKNIEIENAAEYAAVLGESFAQINIITTAGECQILTSKKGKVTVVNRISKAEAPKAQTASHDKDRGYIIAEGKPCEFLRLLGVMDENGNVFDKKRSKFRQINRFLEIVGDVGSELPADDLYVLDLCCGKSYLSFALYYYLTAILGKKVKMIGADLKADVIEYCSQVAKKCNFDGLEFVCCDISKFTPERKPDLVVSLHACDIATDIVLATAIRTEAKVLLSTPCCHHEMAKQLPHEDEELGFIFREPLLRQKFCDIATDALRLLRLRAEGYDVQALEFIDPEETPKNLMLRAIKSRSAEKKADKYKQEYEATVKRLSIDPFLMNLLDKQK